MSNGSVISIDLQTPFWLALTRLLWFLRDNKATNSALKMSWNRVWFMQGRQYNSVGYILAALGARKAWNFVHDEMLGYYTDKA